MTTATTPPSSPARFRPELHGLRGLAIGLVVLYHVFADRVSGGVDVFLFLSAFLLVGTFVRRADAGEPMRPAAYWARAFKRLLPPAAVTVLLTLLTVRLLLPAERWMPAITDAFGSLLQVENWVLIHRGVDYYAPEQSGASPFQHFWSLSMQGQIFLLWPLLIALTVTIARALGRSVRTALVILFLLLLVPSLAWSIHSTATQQTIAYFDTAARAWEFAAGSLLGILLPAWEQRRATGRPRGRHRAVRRSRSAPAAVIGWFGLIALISCGLLLDVQGAFPGWIAAWPLGAAALVLWAGRTGHRFGPDRFLSSAPLRFLGDVSYALYLVHWPLLTLHLARTGAERADPVTGAAIILLSLVLAWLLTRFVDTPFRRWRWAGARARRSGLVVLSVLVLALLPVLGVQQQLLAAQREAQQEAAATHPGAEVLAPDWPGDPDAIDPMVEPLPTAALVSRDWVQLDGPCTGPLTPTDPDLAEDCRMSAPDPAVPDAPVLLVLGNSRAEQAAMSVVEPAREHGWQVVLVRERSCPFIPGERDLVSPECAEHNQAALAYLQQISPTAVMLETTSSFAGQPEVASPVLEETVGDLLADGIAVIALRTTPRFAENPNACLSKGGDIASCTLTQDQTLLAPERPDAAALAQLAEAGPLHPLDLTPVICPGGVCPPIIGNVRVHLDAFHITATYSATMGGEVERQLAESGFPW